MSLQLQLELTQKFPESSQPSLHSQSSNAPFLATSHLGVPGHRVGTNKG